MVHPLSRAITVSVRSSSRLRCGKVVFVRMIPMRPGMIESVSNHRLLNIALYKIRNFLCIGGRGN